MAGSSIAKNTHHMCVHVCTPKVFLRQLSACLCTYVTTVNSRTTALFVAAQAIRKIAIQVMLIIAIVVYTEKVGLSTSMKAYTCGYS